MRVMATVAALWLCGVPGATAQSEDWLVLPTTMVDDAPWIQPTVEKVSRALRLQGVGVWPSSQAVAAFEERGPASPPELSEDLIAAWHAQSLDALRALAQGDVAEALSELEKTQEFSRQMIVALNRDGVHSQSVLDVCLYLVRAYSAAGDPESAEHQARECVRLTPGVSPSARMHPPAVLDAFDRASRPHPSSTGSLLVESEPPGCTLRNNGMLIGDTPVEIGGLYPGRYAIQVECASTAPGRVHWVEVRRGPTSLFVFDRFDRAVRTEPLLHLFYADSTDEGRVARDARQVARALPAAAVVVASRVDPETFEMRVVTTMQAESALVRIPMELNGPAYPTVVDATASLLAGECQDLTGETAVPIDCLTGEGLEPPTMKRAEKRREREGPPRPQRISGAVLVSLGSASLGTSYALLIARGSVGDRWLGQPNSLGVQNRWLALGTGVVVTGSVGGGLAVGAMPLLLPYREKTPWWAWMSGGLGLAATAGSIASAITASPRPPESCSLNGPDPRGCVDRGRDVDRAIVLGVTAAPLLTIPLVYWLRRADKQRDLSLRPGVAVTRTAGWLTLRGAF